MLLRCLLGLLLLVSQSWADTTVSKVITLNYLSADKVQQLIQPLLQKGDSVSGSGQTLVVNVAPDTLTKIRDVLHKIDVPPVTFNVSIYQGDPNWLQSQQSNDVVYSTQSPAEQQRSQSVQVMNGESALVSTSQQVPIVTAVGAGFFTGVSYQQHNIEQGLLVRPVLEGSQVKISVKRIRQQQDPAGGQQFDGQQTDTSIMAPLNKWVALSTAQGAQNPDKTATVYTSGQTFTQNSTLYIKVSIAQ